VLTYDNLTQLRVREAALREAALALNTTGTADAAQEL